ncbi:MAG: helix-turn-helix domain-containing protein [Rhodobacteraceae bacterium]|nr:helix-turn-helix domain-containing protein [Paracoccaceae bacterium]
MDGDRPDSVRALGRGLAILEEVNRSGGIPAGTIAARLGLPRPTVYRLLETLEGLGYVARSASDSRFRVTLRARALGAGYDDGTRMAALAGPVLADVGRALVWPVDLCSFADGHMVVRETTHPRSPLSVDRNMIGASLPLLRSASGRAWLAFTPAPAREAALALLTARAAPEDSPYAEPGVLGPLLARCRAEGVGMRLGEAFMPHTSSFAAPILTEDGVAGCVSIIWITSALPVAEARARFVPPLQQAAARIAALMEQETAEKDTAAAGSEAADPRR